MALEPILSSQLARLGPRGPIVWATAWDNGCAEVRWTLWLCGRQLRIQESGIERDVTSLSARLLLGTDDPTVAAPYGYSGFCVEVPFDHQTGVGSAAGRARLIIYPDLATVHVTSTVEDVRLHDDEPPYHWPTRVALPVIARDPVAAAGSADAEVLDRLIKDELSPLQSELEYWRVSGTVDDAELQRILSGTPQLEDAPWTEHAQDELPTLLREGFLGHAFVSEAETLVALFLGLVSGEARVFTSSHDGYAASWWGIVAVGEGDAARWMISDPYQDDAA